MERNIEQQLQHWQQRERRKPLLVRGARQVGKTFIIKKFIEHSFAHSITIDFEQKPQYKSLFAQDKDSTRIIREIEQLFALG